MNIINVERVFISTSNYKIMKRLIFTSVILLFFSLLSFSQTTHTVNISGLNFAPSNLTISVGDIVNFNGSSNHPILEVSMETWNSNGSTALPGGFAYPSGVGEMMFNTEGTYYYICENHISSGMKGKITVSTPTSTNDIDVFTNIGIYPNPLEQDILNISYDEFNNSNLEVSVFDITSKSLINKAFNHSNNNMTINCSKLSSGVYIVQFRVDDKIKTSKLIKK